MFPLLHYFLFTQKKKICQSIDSKTYSSTELRDDHPSLVYTFKANKNDTVIPKNRSV